MVYHIRQTTVCCTAMAIIWTVHSPTYRAAAQPSFSSSFQDFLVKSADQSGAVNHSGTGQEESQDQGNTDNLGGEFPPQVHGGSTQNLGSTVDLGTVGVNLPF
jgi:hypothetical protein